MKNTNLVKGWKTTVLGSLIILAGLYTVFFMKVSWLDAIIPIGAGTCLLFAPDKLIDAFTFIISSKKKIEDGGNTNE